MGKVHAKVAEISSMPPLSRRRLWAEIAIVLALSLGASAIYSLLRITALLLDPLPLSQQSTALNSAQDTRAWLDFSYQFLGIAFSLAPVALVLYLLWDARRRGTGLGLAPQGWAGFGRDGARGLLLVAVIGIPGIAFYALGRMWGITVAVNASPLEGYWWTVPMLVLAALRSGLQEEVIVVAYLFDRLRKLGWNTWTIILSTAVLRGSYHLYQGIGPFLGNVVMGIVFGWCYQRWGRVLPLVIAHTIIDIISFVGYPLAVAWWPCIFAVPAS